MAPSNPGLDALAVAVRSLSYWFKANPDKYKADELGKQLEAWGVLTQDTWEPPQWLKDAAAQADAGMKQLASDNPRAYAVAMLRAEAHRLVDEMFTAHERFYSSRFVGRGHVDRHMGAWYVVALLGQIAADVTVNGENASKLLDYFTKYHVSHVCSAEIQKQYMAEVLERLGGA